MMKRMLLALLMGAAAFSPAAHTEPGMNPLVRATLDGVVERMRQELSADELGALDLETVEGFLNAQEEGILGSEYLKFTVNVPVTLYIARHARVEGDPFWLEERGFERTDLRVNCDGDEYDVWKKPFPAGEIGLGVNSLSGALDHYVAAVEPQEAGARVEITNVQPERHTVGAFREGELAFCDDDDDYLREVPEALAGLPFVRGSDDLEDAARLVGLFRFTPYPAVLEPDQITLTWSDDPATTQTIQWRTRPGETSAAVAYQKKADYHAFDATEPMRIAAATELLETEDIVNDPVNSRHTATLTGLAPETAYVYSVGDVWSGTWSELREFTTAPAGERPFSFVYLGDAQNGLERWGSVVRKARRRHPEAAFYLLAGDLVNRGQQRQEWDVFFREAQDVYDTRPLVPAPGNHDYDEGSPELYLRLFDLPENGPVSIGPERAYALRYGGALFLMLDSNQPPETQAGWIEEQLADTDATWKFACFHHPVYSSSPTRDNPEIREVWGPLFDEYHVDMVFQGHDHGYLRTHPMKAERVAESPGEGTIYVVSMSGTKKYDQGDFDYAAKAVKDTPTYQVIDILTTGHRLAYRAYDVDGNLIDEVVIEK